MRRRLFLQVYLTLLGIIVLFGVLAVVGWWLTHEESPDADFRRSVGALLVELLPPPGATRAETDAALARLGQDFNARISVFGPEGELLGSLGRPLRPPQERPSGWRKRESRAFT